MQQYNLDRQSRCEIGAELFRLRQERSLKLHQVYLKTKVPERVVEEMEIGRYIQYGYMRRLCAFYGKKLRVTLE